MDVSYHVTQYHRIITELRQKVKVLESQLDRQHSQTTGAGGSGGLLVDSTSIVTLGEREGETEGYGASGGAARVADLCAVLKTTSQEEKEIR